MPKRKFAPADQQNSETNACPALLPSSTSNLGMSTSSQAREFRVTTPRDANSLTDGVLLATPPVGGADTNQNLHQQSRQVILPWLGFGTYRLGKDQARQATFQALKCGYRSIDTAFIYGGEKTETLVGEAIQQALDENIIADRSDVFITTKHWRKYHGYEATLECLELSLKRLGVDYIDLWLMHWPGPAWKTMNREKEHTSEDPWYYAATDQADMVQLRAETWRAMEDAYRQGKVRAIGVSNMTVKHLENLKRTSKLWPPAVNQVELHPLHPQSDLLKYCKQEGIVVQAYASLGGQDMGKDSWKSLIGSPSKSVKKKKEKIDLIHAEPVTELASLKGMTPAQVLLRWGLEQECVLIPKTTSKERLSENAAIFRFEMTPQEVAALHEKLLRRVQENNPEVSSSRLETLTRLCWRTDPLRLLDFE